MTKGLLATEDRHANKKTVKYCSRGPRKIGPNREQNGIIGGKIWVTRSADQIAGVFWGEQHRIGGA
jgi:hypothetical protein